MRNSLTALFVMLAFSGFLPALAAGEEAGDAPAPPEAAAADAIEEDRIGGGLPLLTARELQELLARRAYTVFDDDATTRTLRIKPDPRGDSSDRTRTRMYFFPNGPRNGLHVEVPEDIADGMSLGEAWRERREVRIPPPNAITVYDGVYDPDRQAYWVAHPKMTTTPDPSLVRPMNEAARRAGARALQGGRIVPYTPSPLFGGAPPPGSVGPDPLDP